MKINHDPDTDRSPEHLANLMDEMDRAIIDVKSILTRLSKKLERDKGTPPNA